ncbi:MAG: polysaccharide biosynthesis C-terminal domain-containing protein, partial [Bacillus sp. (in: Bacteria)]|nr:polysaccharide biosynthesis C-terminal domain-containing protein [Bacillus sp. (in: firmicutes)]
VIAEIVVLLAGSLCLKKHVRINRPNKNDILKNLSFGSKAVFGNVLEDFNTRIDVMMLGALASDKIVGLYSFISLIVEGIFKLLYVVRSNMNPIFAELFHNKKQTELSALYKKIKYALWGGTFCLGLFLIIGYWGFCTLFLDKEYTETVTALIIIIIGMTILAPFFVCGNICTQSGRPLQDSLVTLTTIIVNIITNYFLIIRYGLYGAAMATAFSYIIYSILMKTAIDYRIKYH